MLLRPATPLSILFFAAFALLLLSTLSTPIIKAIPLAAFDGVTYGVFGYCQGDACSSMGIGYTTDSGLFSDATTSDFDLPSGARHTLSAILIVHPVAAFMALICFGLAFAAHFHAPSHSPRYLMILLVLTFPTLLVALLAFLVDILLFVPHMAWGGWIVLAATVVIAVSGVVTCAMRRTLVSRKARKKRIAENAEMNGQNYYASRAPPPVMEDPSLPRADSPPPMPAGSPVSPDGKGPEFATFELQKKSMDDRTPLNPQNPSITSGSTDGPNDGPGRYYGEYPPAPPGAPGGRGRGGPRDQYGNPMPPNGPEVRLLSMEHLVVEEADIRPEDAEALDQEVAAGRRQCVAAEDLRPAMEVAEQSRGPPPGPYDDPRDYNGQNQSNLGLLPEPNSPIGQAIEMDARAGTPQEGGINNYGLRDSDNDLQGMIGLQQGRFDGGGNGVPSRQASSASPLSPTSEYSQPPDSFVPARQNWVNHAPAPPPLQPGVSDDSVPTERSRGLSPIAASPVSYKEPIELPGGLSKPPSRQGTSPMPNSGPAQLGHNRMNSGGDNYIEDVDPRFADPDPPSTIDDDRSNSMIPAALMPGFGANRAASPRTESSSPSQVAPLPSEQFQQRVLPNDDGPQMVPYNEFPEDFEGPRSPGAASDTSHFTSISQRGINPMWRPGPGEMGMGRGGPSYGYAPQRGPPRPRQEDVVLEANPDFSIPGVAAPGRGRNIGARGRGGFGGPARAPPAATPGIGLGSAAGGRYPGGSAI
ncbi:regulator of ime2 [Neofusicoccum ribis]|uniref:Regulator of ime2 n=1 Tax=Neofusicoccum ribis TaxID=45134 RepID=A0ABR3TDE7_9PEZI